MKAQKRRRKPATESSTWPKERKSGPERNSKKQHGLLSLVHFFGAIVIEPAAGPIAQIHQLTPQTTDGEPLQAGRRRQQINAFPLPANQTNFQETPTERLRLRRRKMLKNVPKQIRTRQVFFYLPPWTKKGLRRLRKHGQQQRRTSVPLADRQFDSFWSIASLDLSSLDFGWVYTLLYTYIYRQTCIDFHLTLQNSSALRAKFTVEVNALSFSLSLCSNIIVSHSWSENI